MARTSTRTKENTGAAPTTVNDAVVENAQPLNLEQQVTVRNIASWSVGFRRLNSVGDVIVAPRGVVRLSRNEIISQVQNGNKAFTGTDGMGAHATLLIDDAETLKELGYENAVVFSDKLVSEIFEIPNQNNFEKTLVENMRTRAEKYALMLSIVRLNINDYSKIRFVEEYTGYKLDKVREQEKNIR